MSFESSQPLYAGDCGQPSGESCHSSCRPYGSTSTSGKVWLSCSVPRPLECQGVAVAQEDVEREAAAGRGVDVGAERAVGGGVPGHLVADALLVRQGLVDRALGDDDEPRVVRVEEAEAGELRRVARAAPALPLLVVEPHVVVDDELRLALEDVDQPDRTLRTLQGVVGQLDHRQPAPLRGDRVQLPGRRLLPDAQLVQLAAPGVGVDDGR